MEQKFYKFTAATLDDAYQAMRTKLGDDAIVIRTTSVTEGGILGGWFGTKLVEVTASATIDDTTSAMRSLSAVERRYGHVKSPVADVNSPSVGPDTKSAGIGTAKPAQIDHFRTLIRQAQNRMDVDEISSSPNPMRAEFTDPSGGVTPFNGGQTPVTSDATPGYPNRENVVPAEPIRFEAPVPEREYEQLSDKDIRNDISEMRDMLQVLSAEMPGAELPSEFMPHYQTLLDNGVTRKRAASLVHTAAKRGDLRALREPRVFFERLKMEMRKYVQVTGGIVLHAEERRVVAMIGPTGVGKTTNLAKLAALFSVQERAKVGVITADTYRVSATEQLNTYATIIDLDMKIAHDAKEMKVALDDFKNHDLVLIDTAGSSPYNDEQMADLKEFLEAAEPDETHLLVSASTSLDDLKEVVGRYSMMKPTALFCSKLDETHRYGRIYCLAADTGLPLSYLSVGQDVPDDVELAHTGRLASMVTEGKLKRG